MKGTSSHSVKVQVKLPASLQRQKNYANYYDDDIDQCLSEHDT